MEAGGIVLGFHCAGAGLIWIHRLGKMGFSPAEARLDVT